MSRPLDPGEIFDRAATEGERRLDQSTTELVATGFIAGFTIVFGIVALGIVHAAVESRLGDVARVAGALAFGAGLALLIAGRSELFSENFFDPAAAAIDDPDSWHLRPIVRLWALTFAFNLLGGALLVLVVSVEGTLPSGTGHALRTVAEEILSRERSARFASAIVGGALVALLSHVLAAVETDGSRLAMAFIVGVVLALGPLDHVVVTLLHVFLGMRFGVSVGGWALLELAAVATAGNFVGGLGLVTFSHAAQARE